MQIFQEKKKSVYQVFCSKAKFGHKRQRHFKDVNTN